MAFNWTAPTQAADCVAQVLLASTGPFFVNFALAFPPLALDAALEAGAPIITFSWGDSGPYLARVREAGALVGIQVTNPQGAKRAVDQGADFLICQGIEAGGHVQSTTSLSPLLPIVLSAAGRVPVIAAGGLASGQDIAGVLNVGASGAMLGTRFVATQESRAHPEYKRLLVEATGEPSLTMCYDGGWPGSAHRVLRNSTLEQWEAHGCPPPGQRPGEADPIASTADGSWIHRYDSAAPRFDHSGQIEPMCLYSGTGVGKIADIPSAADLLSRLWSDCLPWLETAG